MAGDDVACSNRAATDGVGRGVAATDDAAVVVAQRGSAGGVQADVVADDYVAGRAGAPQLDAGPAVARNHVAVGRRGAANGVVGRLDVDTVLAVAGSCGAGGRQADVVAGDQVVAAPGQRDAAALELVDHQATHRRPATRDRQPEVRAIGAAAVEFDQRRTVPAALAAAVDHQRLRDVRQCAAEVDRLQSAGADREQDPVGPAGAVGGVVGRGDCLAQRDFAVGAPVGQQGCDRADVAVDQVVVGVDDQRRRQVERHSKTIGGAGETGVGATGARDAGGRRAGAGQHHLAAAERQCVGVVVAGAAEVTAIDQVGTARAGGIEDGEESIGQAAVAALGAIGGDGQAGRVGASGNEYLARTIDRDRAADIVAVAAQVGGVDACCAAAQRRVEHRHESFDAVVEAGLECTAGGAQVGRVGVARDVDPAPRAVGYGAAGVGLVAAEQGTVNHRVAGGVELEHIGVVAVAERGVEGVDQAGAQVGRLGMAGDRGPATAVHGNRQSGVGTVAGDGEAVERRAAGGVELRDADVGGNAGADRRHEVGLAAGIDRDAVALVGQPPRDHPRVQQAAAVDAELGGEGIRPGADAAIEQRRIGGSGDVNLAGGVDRDRVGAVGGAATDVGGVDDAREVGRQLDHHRVTVVAARQVDRAVSTQRHTAHLLRAGVAEIGSISQCRVDHQRARVVVGADLEPDAAIGRQQVAAGHHLAAVGAVLVTHRCVEQHPAATGQRELQRAIGIDGHLLGAVEAQRDLAPVGAGADDEVVFQLLARSVITQVDAVVDAVVTHRGMVFDILQPLPGRADQVVGARGDRAFGQRGRVGRGAHQRHVQGGAGRAGV